MFNNIYLVYFLQPNKTCVSSEKYLKVNSFPEKKLTNYLNLKKKKKMKKKNLVNYFLYLFIFFFWVEDIKFFLKSFIFKKLEILNFIFCPTNLN